MRRAALWVLAVAAVLFVLGGAIALAEPKPEVIDEADLLRVQLAQAYAELREHMAAEAKRDADAAIAALRAKYHLGEADSVDPQTRAIRRAPKKPESKKEAK